MILRLVLCGGSSKVAAISEAAMARKASVLTFSRACDFGRSPDSWYYRCVGSDGKKLVSLELVGGQLSTVELAIFGEDQSMLDVVRSMEVTMLSCGGALSLEALHTDKVHRLIHNGVDVGVDPLVARLGSRIVVGIDFQRARRAYRDESGITYYTDDDWVVVGMGVDVSSD